VRTSSSDFETRPRPSNALLNRRNRGRGEVCVRWRSARHRVDLTIAILELYLAHFERGELVLIAMGEAPAVVTAA